MNDNDYVSKLENVIKQMLLPLEDIPFNLVVESLTGRKVISFDFDGSDGKALLGSLKQVKVVGRKEINQSGMESRRLNEVGNYIEKFVTRAMWQYALNLSIPAGPTGRRKATGYLDIASSFQGSRYYLGCN